MMRATQYTSLRFPGLDEHAHAAKCAAVISEFWQRQGYQVSAWVEEVVATTRNSAPTWGVRSDLHNGKPRE